MPTQSTPPATAEKVPVGGDFTNSKFTELESALRFINSDCDEATWKLHILAPLAKWASENPADAGKIRQLAEDWSSGKLAGKPSIAWTTPGNQWPDGGTSLSRGVGAVFIRQLHRNACNFGHDIPLC